MKEVEEFLIKHLEDAAVAKRLLLIALANTDNRSTAEMTEINKARLLVADIVDSATDPVLKVVRRRVGPNGMSGVDMREMVSEMRVARAERRGMHIIDQAIVELRSATERRIPTDTTQEHTPE